MRFLKQYYVWIIIAVIFLALVGVQLLWIGSRRDQRNSVHNAIKQDVEKLHRQARTARRLPTKKDKVNAQEHLTQIQAEGSRAQKALRRLTDRLNTYMSGGKREGGEITDPATVKKDPKTGRPVPGSGKPQRWEEFAAFMDHMYKQLHADLEAGLAEELRPEWQKLLEDEFYANDRNKTQAEAKAESLRLVASVGAHRARILVGDSKKIPVDLDDAAAFEEDKSFGWRVWRSYLISADILLRAVVKSRAEVVRMLNAQYPLAEDKRAEYKAKLDEEDEVKDPGAGPWERKEVRFIENISELKVTGPDYGDGVLPAPDNPELEGVKAGDNYRDTFTVTITMTAHMKVINSFMREILKTKDMFYVPVSLEITRIPDAESMGYYTPNWGDGGEGERPSWMVQKIAGYEREPAVTATLVYKIYRYRYADTDNHTPAEDEEED